MCTPGGPCQCSQRSRLFCYIANGNVRGTCSLQFTVLVHDCGARPTGNAAMAAIKVSSRRPFNCQVHVTKKLRNVCRRTRAPCRWGMRPLSPLKVACMWLHYRVGSPHKECGLMQVEKGATNYAVVVLHVVHLQSSAGNITLRRTINECSCTDRSRWIYNGERSSRYSGKLGAALSHQTGDRGRTCSRRRSCSSPRSCSWASTPRRRRPWSRSRTRSCSRGRSRRSPSSRTSSRCTSGTS